jgi:hydrogenase nickel incorporation protein HypA/HybF
MTDAWPAPERPRAHNTRRTGWDDLPAEVRVRIGELAGVETALLRKAYDTFREGTLCGGAALVIEPAAARWECPYCSSDLTRRPFLSCDRCNRPGKLVDGDQILLERVEMEVA